MNFSKFLNILSKYCIIDFLIIIIYIVLIIVFQLKEIPDNFVPYITDDIDNPLRDGNGPEAASLILIFVFLLIITVIWFSNRNDIIVLKLITSYLSGVFLTYLVSLILQHLILRPRPDTIAQCGRIEDCKSTLNKKDYIEQFTSLPSKSSAITMAAGIFLTLYFEDIWSSSSMFSVLFKFLPIGVPLFIGADEIVRRYSRIDDVLMGYVIGLLIGYISYKSFIKNCDVKEKAIKRYQNNSDMFLINQQ